MFCGDDKCTTLGYYKASSSTCNETGLNVRKGDTCPLSIGMKFDTDKLRWDLLPLGAIEQTVEILTKGAKKYAPGNWRYVKDAQERYYAAMLRHLTAWRKGEKVDTEMGTSHLAHIICNAIFLYELEQPRDKADKTSSPV